MKLKIKIVGPKVYDVGYRYFLMSNAMDLNLSGFHARNRPGGKEQEVIALVEGDEVAIGDFKSLTETNRPSGAEVSIVTFEEYDGAVMPAGQYAQVCTALQLNKAIPVLLEIRDSSKAMLEKQDKTIEEIKGLREDLQPEALHRRHLQSDIRAIKDRLGMP